MTSAPVNIEPEGDREIVITATKAQFEQTKKEEKRSFFWHVGNFLFGRNRDGTERVSDKRKTSYLQMMITGVGNAGSYTPGSMGTPVNVRISAAKAYVDTMNHPITDPLPRLAMNHHWGGGAYTIGGKPNGPPLMMQDIKQIIKGKPPFPYPEELYR